MVEVAGWKKNSPSLTRAIDERLSSLLGGMSDADIESTFARLQVEMRKRAQRRISAGR